MVERLARDLADRGLVIASGLARGIDACNHRRITACLAMEVFGVPGNATQEVSFGPNQLVKQGAKPVTS